jgi:Domain of unknown function (DUF4158)
VPATVIEHVRAVLGLDAEVAIEHDSTRTAKWHCGLIRQFLGVVYEPAQARKVADAAIREAVKNKDDPADLINVALEELVRERCELLGYTTLDKMTSAIRTEYNTALFATVDARIARPDRAGLTQLLVVDPTSRRSGFDRLKMPAKAASLSKFKLRLAYLRELDALGPTEKWLEGIPATKIAHFAGEARVTDVGDLRDMGEPKRWTLLASLIHEARTSARDEVATMFCKRMATIHKKGRDYLDELHEAHRAESERLLGVFGDVLSVVREALGLPDPGADEAATPAKPQKKPSAKVMAERAGHAVLQTLTDAGGLAALAASHEAVSAHHGNNYLPLLERFYNSHRSALFTLLDTVELEATSADRSVLDAVEFVRACRNRVGKHVRG